MIKGNRHPTQITRLYGRRELLRNAGACIPLALIGGEAAGLSTGAEQLGTGRVMIPMAGPVESLNAAMAATVLVFEAARQRRHAPSTR